MKQWRGYRPTYRMFTLHGGYNDGAQVHVNPDEGHLFMHVAPKIIFEPEGEMPDSGPGGKIEVYVRKTMAVAWPGHPSFRCWYEYWADGATPTPTDLPDGFGDYR